MKILLLSATLIGAGLMITGPTLAQTAQEKIKPVQTAQRDDTTSSQRGVAKGTESNTTTGLSSAAKEHEEMGAPAHTGSTRSATTGMSNSDTTTGLSSAKKEHEEGGGAKK